jgi:hypothetical protein
MLPLALCVNAPASFVLPTCVKELLVIVGADAVPGAISGTDRSKYQVLVELLLPALHMPNDVVPTFIVSLVRPLGVVQAVTVAGGGQKPTLSAKAGIEKANSKTKETSSPRVSQYPRRFVLRLTNFKSGALLLTSFRMVLMSSPR